MEVLIIERAGLFISQKQITFQKKKTGWCKENRNV
jgi:hypothetical protein